MDKVRPIMPPAKPSKNFTLAEARAAFRELNRERAANKAKHRSKRAAKAG